MMPYIRVNDLIMHTTVRLTRCGYFYCGGPQINPSKPTLNTVNINCHNLTHIPETMQRSTVQKFSKILKNLGSSENH